MCRKLICLACFVFVAGLAGSASADLVVHWKLDETFGATAYDSSGNGYDGKFVGTPEWADGYHKGAVHIRAEAQSVLYSFASAEPWPAGTVTLWVKPDSVGQNEFSSAFSSHTPNSSGFQIDMDGTSPGIYRCNPGGNFGVVTADWVHLAVAWDGTSGNLYYNGSQTASVNLSTNNTTFNEFAVGINRNVWDSLIGLIDDFRAYDVALTGNEILQTMIVVPPGLASGPIPADEVTDVPREVILNWTPGEFAGQHDVYFGISFDDVDAATNLDPMGPDNLYRARQAGDSYSVPERLDFGQTYYWRIDEVNAPPTSHVVFKGNVWSFTAESFAYPIENIAATASSSFNESTGPENTVDGSGLDADDLHSVQEADIWLTSMTAQPPTWIRYEFDKVYKLHEMWVWNYNQMIEPIVGFGLKDVTIEHSVDGTDWAELADVPEFARAPGMAGYAHNTTVDFGGVGAKYVKITANDNWGFLNQYGLSEVRFLYIPIWATEPNPDSGTTNVGLDATLGFRAGREAAKHDVYFSSDEQAVIDGTTPVATVTEAGYDPLSLDLGKTYYWRVDEVNETETPTTWQGDIWNFTAQKYLAVDDFEAYDDYEPYRIFDTWTDGWGVPTNGATMGYTEPVFILDEHFVETTIVHSGRQSAPLFYDNTAGATYSEVTRTVDAPRDWTQAGVKGLTLWFYGDPNNPVTEQMYVKVNGSKVTYDGDPENLTRRPWQVWYIDLAGLGVNLTNITELTIGLERSGLVGGKGMVYFDDIRLSAYDRQFVTPAEPNTAGLLAHWKLDEGSGTTVIDASGNGRDGTFNGDPQWVAGKFGGALQFDGIDDYVIHTLGEARNFDSFTVALWTRAATLGQGQYMASFSSHTPNTSGIQIDVDGTNPGSYRLHPAGLLFGPVTTEWIHLAVVGEGTAVQLYYNGTLALKGDATANDLLFNEFILGTSRNIGNFFDGAVDDFRVYDRALTQDEIAWLGGRTTPFDKPFRSP